MTKPTPSPCDKCPPYKKKPCNEHSDTCLKWVQWIMDPENREKYRQEILR